MRLYLVTNMIIKSQNVESESKIKGVLTQYVNLMELETY
jgi:hypothetical protein